ncbi:helix-turn-helix domain-containing protein [Arthrobacter woluwensis]|uniref:helix-turn-helix domain-containing protein n=1 Tax=Arthrobacter woluwensis TaxID=156980 RepID=UPI00119DA6DA|nr:helix-turn-helix domain-containing protein [Arthrobacter woluwensis]
MDNINADALADKVAASILRSDRSQSSIAAEIGMAKTTFNRKVKGSTEWTVSELLRIAKAIGVSPSELVPTEFFARAAA